MGRWEPDAAGRLQRAAMELYAERGYAETTVAEIAQRAGLTERTFFRHFADKREAAFHGARQLRDELVTRTLAAPPDASALDAVAFALESIAPFFDERRAFSLRRRAVIASSSELQERELVKRASLVVALSEALRERGEDDATASVASELGIAAFHIAYDRWVGDPGERGYATHASEAVAQLRAACGATGRTAATRR